MKPSDAKKNNRRRGKFVPIDEALRREEMGEPEYAIKLKCFFELVEGDTSASGVAKKGDPKLMLDGLKEWGRHLEPKRVAGGSSVPETPVMVQLLHTVPRPDRTADTVDESGPPPASEGA
jgi:hypothetical protein